MKKFIALQYTFSLFYGIVILYIILKEGARVDVQVGDTLLMKKPHPCGGNRFAVLRIGADFRIRCIGCGREVMVPRAKIEKNIKKILREETE